jgi:hypothetical protein
VDRDAALADFDVARASWEAVFAEVPDAALDYLKPGDDYAIGGLQVHVNWVLVHYRRVLDALIAGHFSALEPLTTAAEWVRAGQKAKAGIEPSERQALLEEMAGSHAAVAAAVRGRPADDWTRKTPVRYGPTEDPYPTSLDDLLGWLRDHYREHVEQCPELVAEWRGER